MSPAKQLDLKACMEKMQELSVYGFIRRYYEIPDDLKQLCLSFILILRDLWKEERSHSCVKINNETGEGITTGSSHHKNVFGSFIIRKGDMQTWKMKITNARRGPRSVLFGIITYKQNELSFYKHMMGNFIDACEYSCELHAYSWDSWDGVTLCSDSKHSQRKYGQNEIISMTLDLTENRNKKNGTLSYTLNHKPLGVMIDDIDINQEYCMAVALFFDDSLQLLS